MNEKEVINYLELDNYVFKIESQSLNVTNLDSNYILACMERFPFFDMKESQEYKLRDEALKKYYEMLIVFFISSCKLICDTSDEIILNAVNASIIHLNNILATRTFNVKLLPLAKQVYDSYNLAIAKLLKAGLKENASQLERLRYRVFMHWTAVRTQ